MRCSAGVLMVASDRKVSTAVSDYNSNVVQRRGANGRQRNCNAPLALLALPLALPSIASSVAPSVAPLFAVIRTVIPAGGDYNSDVVRRRGANNRRPPGPRRGEAALRQAAQPAVRGGATPPPIIVALHGRPSPLHQIHEYIRRRSVGDDNAARRLWGLFFVCCLYSVDVMQHCEGSLSRDKFLF
jgi:hypothetical protein